MYQGQRNDSAGVRCGEVAVVHIPQSQMHTTLPSSVIPGDPLGFKREIRLHR
jgi:hypothetical protein